MLKYVSKRGYHINHLLSFSYNSFLQIEFRVAGQELSFEALSWNWKGVPASKSAWTAPGEIVHPLPFLLWVDFFIPSYLFFLSPSFKNSIIEVTYNKVHIFKAYHLIHFEVWIYSWNHHHNKWSYNSTWSFLMPHCNSSIPPVPTLISSLTQTTTDLISVTTE